MDESVNPPTPPHEDTMTSLADQLEPISPEASNSDVILNNTEDDNTADDKSQDTNNEEINENKEDDEENSQEEAPPKEDEPDCNNKENDQSPMEVDEVSNETSEPLKETQQDVEMNDDADEEQSQDAEANDVEAVAAAAAVEDVEEVAKDVEEAAEEAAAKDVEDEADQQGVDESGVKDTGDPTSADDDGADSTNVEANTTTNIDESMEQDELDRPEQVNMENLADTTIDKDKSISEDPFDSVKQSKNHTAAETTSSSEQRQDNEELDADDDHDRDDVVNESAADETTENVDDEQAEGVDEDLSLLPDAEREISDADKERALLAEEQAESSTVEPLPEEDVTTIIDDDDDDEQAVQNQTNEEAQNDLTTTADQNETTENDTEAGDATSKQNAGEIKEILSDELPEKQCRQCATLRLCKYTVQESDSEEIAHLCEIDCVNEFRTATTESKKYTLTVKKVFINMVADSEQTCVKCSSVKTCKYRMASGGGGNNDDEVKSTYDYLCDDTCLNAFVGKNVDKYVVRKKRYTIEEISETADSHPCIQCSESNKCRFQFKQDTEELYVCHENCLNLLIKEQPDRFRVKRRSVRVRDLPKRAGLGSATIAADAGEPAASAESMKMLARTEAEANAARNDRESSFIRRCSQCFSVVELNDRNLNWETMDFCNETCLGQYQNVIGAACTTCQNAVNLTSLGKYCVRFGYEIRQFCRSSCLDEFKKGLKVCSYCQKDISKNVDGFLASVAGQFKDFCTQTCLKKYDEMCNPKKKSQGQAGICSVCNNVEQIRVEILIDGREHPFCSNPCFSAFKFVNNIVADECSMCSKYFERKSHEAYTIYHDKSTLMYCSKICMNIYIITNRKIVPCQWCKVKKYNFDMIQKFSGPNTIMLCSLNCLTLCEVSMNAISMKKQKCDQCNAMVTPQYHLTMSDATIRNFCTYQCVMSFQSQFSRAPLTLDGESNSSAVNNPVPAGLPKRIKSNAVGGGGVTTTNLPTVSIPQQQKGQKQPHYKIKIGVGRPPKQSKANAAIQNKVPIIANVTSLASHGISTRGGNRKGGSSNMMTMSLQPVVELEPLPPTLLKKSVQTYGRNKTASMPLSPPPRLPTPPPRVEYKTQVVTIPPMPKRVANMTTMCKPSVESKEVSCRPSTNTIGCQTDDHLERKLVIPIPVPIYVPQPMHMYSLPTPIPVPIPLPIPVPIFIPTTRNSAQGIMKEIKKIQDKMPADPFEAELLMMAEMVAGDKKKSDSDSGSDDDADDDYGAHETITESNSALGEDMLQMALKMAQEYDEPAVDLESAMTANTITPSSHPHLQYEGDVDDHAAIQHHHMLLMEQQRQMPVQRGRKRGVGAGGGRGGGGRGAQQQQQQQVGSPPNKRGRRSDMAILTPQQPPQPEPPREPVEKADANMCLKFTFGVNAWKQWVMTKNADLEKSSIRRKPFKSELLQLTADELNYSLCLFVKEVRKPNGSEYAPDTIYYLVLGVQQYLYENGRIDNIFTDPYYEKFTDCLDDVAKKFSVLYNDSQYIVTRVEEEHLWECKQLGAHSPHVLLSTLMFFNTKHFNLTTVEEHMQLSFSHIMKHWKRNPNQVGAAKVPGSRNVLLRFYPPQSSLENNSRKKKVYEQQENEENPLRCPVKLYEFYLSKCPESVKTRNDVFYLQPERSCVPDSPVWYSTQALGKESLCKMLHRVKMVKEINIALLTS